MPRSSFYVENELDAKLGVKDGLEAEIEAEAEVEAVFTFAHMAQMWHVPDRLIHWLIDLQRGTCLRLAPKHTHILHLFPPLLPLRRFLANRDRFDWFLYTEDDTGWVYCAPWICISV